MIDTLKTVMVQDTVQYLTAMIQIYITNIILVIFVPAMIWKSRLAKKSLREGFLFCVGTQICYMVNLVFVLGFLHINNRYTLFLGIVLEYVFIRKVILKESVFSRTRIILINTGYLLRGRKSLMILFNEIFSYCHRKLAGLKRSRVVLSIKDHPFQYGIIVSFLLYNCYFITHQVMIYFSYQFSDLPVHTSWIYEMENGNMFSAGIYPFAMHCMIYIVHQFSGAMLRDVVLFYGSFQTMLTIVCLYLFAEKIFKWKYSPYVALILFSLLFNQGRYGASLPQECGIFAIYGMGYYLITVFDDQPVLIEKKRRNKKKAGEAIEPETDENTESERNVEKLESTGEDKISESQESAVKSEGADSVGKKVVKLLSWNYMMLAIYVGLVIAFHFYSAIAAIIVAISIVASRILRFFKWNYFKPIFLAAVAGAVIAVTPFVAYLAQGYEFQESMAWAVSVINGEEWQGTGQGYLESIEGDGEYVEGTAGSATEQTEELIPIYKQNYSAEELAWKMLSDMRGFIDGNGNLFKGYIADVAGLAILVGLISGVLLLFNGKMRTQGSNYLALSFACSILLFMGCCADWNVIVIMEAPRVSSFIQPLLMLTMTIIFDFGIIVVDTIHKLLFGVKGKEQLEIVLTLAACGALVFVIYNNSWTHSYFDVNLAYYNEPDYLIKQIRKENEPYTYSIVSPTDEYYAVVDKAYHVEISEFVAMVDGNKKSFKIPTKKVYFFIEKQTLQDYYNGSDQVKLEYAKEDFQYRASTQDYYYQRNIIESKAYYWAEEYKKMYPNQMKLYYEDDIYICYELTQEINAPFRYEIDYIAMASSGLSAGN